MLSTLQEHHAAAPRKATNRNEYSKTSPQQHKAMLLLVPSKTPKHSGSLHPQHAAAIAAVVLNQRGAPARLMDRRAAAAPLLLKNASARLHCLCCCCFGPGCRAGSDALIEPCSEGHVPPVHLNPGGTLYGICSRQRQTAK